MIARVDRILEPYGGLGAIPRALQLSHWTVQNELSQLQTFGFMLPLIFMMVAAFILNVALTRALALQRPQIAALKALGYDNRAIGWHYLKWALAIGLAGVVIGVVLGAMMGNLIIGLYNTFFRFPVLLFSVPPSVVVGATVHDAGRGRSPARSPRCAARSRVPPAEAMRPEAPTRYRRSLFETPLVSRHLGTAGRMVLRNVMRHPLRAAASVFGIAFAVAILMIGFVFNDAIDRLMLTQFWDAERQDVTRQLHRASRRERAIRARRACRAWSRSSRSGPWPRASARAIAIAISRSPACRRTPASSASSIATAARSACRRRAWCCR